MSLTKLYKEETSKIIGFKTIPMKKYKIRDQAIPDGYVYLDVCALVDFAANRKGNAELMFQLFQEAEKGNVKLVTGNLTMGQIRRVLRESYCLNQMPDYIEKFAHLLATGNEVYIHKTDYDYGTEKEDDIHLRTAKDAGATKIITSDREFQEKAEEIGIIPVSPLDVLESIEA